MKNTINLVLITHKGEVKEVEHNPAIQADIESIIKLDLVLSNVIFKY